MSPRRLVHLESISRRHAGSRSRRLQQSANPSPLDELLGEHIARGELAGAVVGIVSHGKVTVTTQGLRSIESRSAMTEDTLFRIASMTKVFTSVVLLTLVEEGKVRLDAPVGDYLPELKDLKVGRFDEDGELLSSAPAQRPVTILDLLRHTSGLTYSSPAALDRLYRERGLRSGTLTGTVFLQRLAKLPLAEEPGTKFRYSLATDVLGLVIERVTGERLDEVLEMRVFRPLEMNSTGFVVAEEDANRLASVYRYGADGLELEESAEESPLRKEPVTISGGGGWGDTGSLGGAVSTIGDLLRFYRMLLGGGALGAQRVLESETVELMTRDHLIGMDGLFPGTGFGLGFAVVRDRGAFEGANPGAYFWGGSESTFFVVDPSQKLVAVFLTQVHPFGHLDLGARFRSLVTQQ